MNSKDSKHFCILPWKSLQIKQNGKISACSRDNIVEKRYLGDLRKNSLSEIWNDAPIRDMRRALMKDQAVSACANCYEMESLGLLSDRQTFNELYRNEIETQLAATDESGKVPEKSLTFLEIKLSNKCNFTCRTCEAYSSTSWYPETKNVLHLPTPDKVLRPMDNTQEFRDTLEKQIPHIETISLLGGEPLYDENHYWLLEKLIELKRTDVKILYNTNFSSFTYKDKNVLDLWKHFETVLLRLSFDGVGVQSEYIRKGQIWKNCETQFTKLRLFAPHVKVMIYTCISVLNCYHITTAIDYWIEKKMLHKPLGLRFSILDAPSCYNLKILNKAERINLIVHYQNWLKKLKTGTAPDLYEAIACEINGLVHYISNENYLQERKEFVKVTKALDKSRSEDFISLFPELSSLFN
ncbi:MAG: twitch domain-containing radical SAM protein [Pseudobdellovibrio sp.]